MFRCIDTNTNDAYFNMAVDECILDEVSQGRSNPVLRFYGWSPPGISLGYFQKVRKSVDVNFCKENNISIVRRLTGGRTVLHADELTYSIIIPESHCLANGSVTNSYKNISVGILEGLKKIGIPAEISSGTSKESNSSACFEATSKYEIVINGKKIVGSAQTRKKGCLLQHGSIVISLDLEFFSKMLCLTDSQRNLFLSSFREKASDIKTETGKVVKRNVLIEGIKYGFVNFVNIDLQNDRLSKEEIKKVETLYDKYKSDEWINFR